MENYEYLALIKWNDRLLKTTSIIFFQTVDETIRWVSSSDVHTLPTRDTDKVAPAAPCFQRYPVVREPDQEDLQS